MNDFIRELSSPRIKYVIDTWVQDFGWIILGAILAVVILRAFVWPHYIRPRMDAWCEGEISRLELKIKEQRIELSHTKRVLEEYKVVVRTVHGALATVRKEEA